MSYNGLKLIQALKTLQALHSLQERILFTGYIKQLPITIHAQVIKKKKQSHYARNVKESYIAYGESVFH
jgi:hypothetical protein